ncbi:hypothetical protein TRP8649_00985 [Pelagimonas phthalicica]|uniref:DUF3576 domain-containing protein n=2 Tax=Pelagimonas phthalicica TaxID=1037362 RepID=A0A238J9M0_9RHOB|nr:uncharacterized protein DUF3576 [Pelagimonas phthalicica]SMX26887.1 hypothetical protein TRP8649_00985 [Pelagimonas phthalicica]
MFSNDILLPARAPSMQWETRKWGNGRMSVSRIFLGLGLSLVVLVEAGCSRSASRQPVDTPPASEILDDILYEGRNKPRGTIWDLFRSREDQGQIGAVNKYIWNASLETLDFLPVQSIDPFSGVIITGYGTPPGGGRAYRATIHVNDPALDARSLNVALSTRSGPVSAATVRAIEDAILTRARQLRAQDSRL